MLAERYPDESERGNAIGISIGGISLGVLSKYCFNKSIFK
jgi:hypothetical protein